MALKAGYKGIKDVGDGLQITTDGVLEITGESVVIPNPEGEATETLTKLEVGSTIYSIEADTSDCYKTSDGTESNIVDADYIPFLDSSAGSGSGAAKKSTWSNFVSKIAAKLPTADPSTKGVVKVGAGLNINNSDELFIQGGNGITVNTENDEEWINATSDAKISEAITGLVTTADTVQDALEGLAEWVSANPSNPNGADLVALQIGSTKHPLPFDKYFPRSEQAVLGAKNLLPLTLASIKASTSGGSWADNVYTNGDVAYTIFTNSAGYVTNISANGTADPSNDSYFRLITNLDSYLTVGVDYTLNGCPSGGSQNSYVLYTGSAGVWDDIGEGASETYANTIKNLFIKIKGGTTVTNISFKPMIRLGSDPDSTFAPYAMTNEELTDALADTGWKELETDSTYVSGGSVRYRLKAGICYVAIEGIQFANSGNAQTVANGLPKPTRLIAGTSVPSTSTDAPSNNGFFVNSNSSVLSCHVGKASISNYLTLVYPVG